MKKENPKYFFIQTASKSKDREEEDEEESKVIENLSQTWWGSIAGD